jgi:hypothetical protein
MTISVLRFSWSEFHQLHTTGRDLHGNFIPKLTQILLPPQIANILMSPVGRQQFAIKEIIGASLMYKSFERLNTCRVRCGVARQTFPSQRDIQSGSNRISNCDIWMQMTNHQQCSQSMSE